VILKAQIEDLARILGGGWSDRLQQERLRSAGWSSSERARYTAGLRQALEDWLRHDWILRGRLRKQPRPKMRAALHLGLVELEAQQPVKRVLGSTLEALGKLSPPERKLVHGVLAALIREPIPLAPLPLDDEKQALALSVPGWLLKLLKQVNPDAEATTTDLSRMLLSWRQRSLWLRVNLSSWSREEALSSLCQQGWACEAVDGTADFLKVQAQGEEGLSGLEALADGRLQVQDLSTHAPLTLLDPQPGNRVLDMCAAPGNKSRALLEGFEGIQLTALEKHPGRARNLKRRLGDAARVLEQDALTFSDKPFERILLDAPCGGTGTIARRPEMLLGPDPVVPELLQLQAELLDHAASLLADGGRLVYSTCSLDRRENACQVKAFLDRHSAFHLIDEAVPLSGRDTDGGWAWLPFAFEGRAGSRPGANGAWSCVLEKRP
jgi:16S rRNA (cytosine967-C5)-methyltransferase